AALLAELNYYRMREPLIQAPEQKLDSYFALYRERRPVAEPEAALALKDAAWVLSKEAKASATAKAKALAVKGLVARNQDKHAEAKQRSEERRVGKECRYRRVRLVQEKKKAHQ